MPRLTLLLIVVVAVLGAACAWTVPLADAPPRAQPVIDACLSAGGRAAAELHLLDDAVVTCTLPPDKR